MCLIHLLFVLCATELNHHNSLLQYQDDAFHNATPKKLNLTATPTTDGGATA